MKNLNKRTEFDKQWEDIFKDAEMTPSEGVWDKIDSALSREEAGYFRKRAFLFKLLAAASIAFAIGVGIFSLKYYLEDTTGQVADDAAIENENQYVLENSGTVSDDMALNEESASKEDLSPVVAGQSSTEENVSVGPQTLSEDRVTYSEAENIGEVEGSGKQILSGKGLANAIGADLEQNDRKSADEIGTGTNTLVLASGKEDNETSSKEWAEESTTEAVVEHFPRADNSRKFVSVNALDAKGIDVNGGEETLYTIDHIYRIPIMPRGASKKNKKDYETGIYLAGLDFSAGVFDPNFQQGGSSVASAGGALFNAQVETVNDQLTSFGTANKDFLLVRDAGRETEPEIAYSYGANLGFKLSKRIVLQTGIAYRKANTTTTTTGYIESSDNSRVPIVASHQYQLDGLSSVQKSSATDLNNQYEFASIPLRAGYVFLDKRFNLTFLAGISSEFFLNNQIVDDSDYFETLSNSSGEEGSPYRSIYFNGSLGTMLGYTIAKKYMISLEPSYRFAVNSFTKDDFYLDSYPSSFMLSFGVSYNFK